MSAEINDYSGWMHSLPPNPQQKDWKQLATKLKSYIESPKFMRTGSTYAQVDPVSGKLVKRPVSDVVHKISPQDKSGIKAQDLRSMIQQAVVTGDKQLLRDVSKYKYITAHKFVSQKQMQKQMDRRVRRRLALTAMLLGGAGATAGAALPFIANKESGQQNHLSTYKDALKLAGIGAVTGIGTAGLIQSFR